MLRRLLAVLFAVGLVRIGFYYLVYEPVAGLRRPDVGAELEPLRPLLRGVPRVGYLSDEPLDSDPSLPRRFDSGDMRYARAQYALAPTILAHADPRLPLLLASFVQPAGLDRALASGEYSLVSRPSPALALLRRR
jgi:hypothetical protein